MSHRGLYVVTVSIQTRPVGHHGQSIAPTPASILRQVCDALEIFPDSGTTPHHEET